MVVAKTLRRSALSRAGGMAPSCWSGPESTLRGRSGALGIRVERGVSYQRDRPERHRTSPTSTSSTPAACPASPGHQSPPSCVGPARTNARDRRGTRSRPGATEVFAARLAGQLDAALAGARPQPWPRRPDPRWRRASQSSARTRSPLGRSPPWSTGPSSHNFRFRPRRRAAESTTAHPKYQLLRPGARCGCGCSRTSRPPSSAPTRRPARSTGRWPRSRCCGIPGRAATGGRDRRPARNTGPSTPSATRSSRAWSAKPETRSRWPGRRARPTTWLEFQNSGRAGRGAREPSLPRPVRPPDATPDPPRRELPGGAARFVIREGECIDAHVPKTSRTTPDASSGRTTTPSRSPVRVRAHRSRCGSCRAATRSFGLSGGPATPTLQLLQRRSARCSGDPAGPTTGRH